MNLFRGRVQRLEEKIRIPGQIHVIEINQGDSQEKVLSRYRKNQVISRDDDIIFIVKFGKEEEAPSVSPLKDKGSSE